MPSSERYGCSAAPAPPAQQRAEQLNAVLLSVCPIREARLGPLRRLLQRCPTTRRAVKYALQKLGFASLNCGINWSS